MSGGPLRSRDVVEASRGLQVVKVDLTRDDSPNAAWADRYGIRAIPEMVFLGPGGEEVERGTEMAAAPLAARFRRVAERHRREPFFRPMDEARRKATEDAARPRPIAVLRADRSDLVKRFEDLLLDAELRPIADRFVWVREVTAPRPGETSVPALVVLAVEGDGVAERGRVPLALPEEEREPTRERARAWLLEAWTAWDSAGQ